MKKTLVVFVVFIAISNFAQNPLELREYQQKIIISFASEKDAQNAVITPKHLPADYTLAFSSRWDDTAITHLATHKVMLKNNMKGTFYIGEVDNIVKRNPNYFSELLKGGCSFGLHTLTHPQLPGENAYEHFREYMLNRIQIETRTQSPVNSQVLPFCNWWTPDLKIPQSIGWAMRASGVISSPDVMYPDREKELGYPAQSLAQSRYLNPGDRNPDLAKLEKQLTAALNNRKALAIQPSLSMAMHSWHTEEGLVNLDKAYAGVANNPQWWYCNQNEYGAYRYEALNCRISKKVNGKNAEFTVSRIMPFELGADVPLWFSIDGAKPDSLSGAKLHGLSVELPHSAEHTVPSVFGYAGKDGKCNKIPFAVLFLHRTAEKSWLAEFKTLDGKVVEELDFTFRFPVQYDRETVRKAGGTTANIKVTASVSSKKTDLFYRYGRPYYAVQADFVREGKRYRLYADLHEAAEKNLPLTMNEAARYFISPENPDLAKLSVPSINPAELGLSQAEIPRRANTGTGVLYPGTMNNRNWKGNAPYLAVIDFKPLNSGKLILVSTVGQSWKKSELWLNGKKVEFTANTAEVTPLDGVNRFVLKAPKNLVHSLFLNGENQQCVEFIKSIMKNHLTN